jgi:hypothetical protein
MCLLRLQLPSLVAFIWSAELLPRYGGVVDSGQYGLWLGREDSSCMT